MVRATICAMEHTTERDARTLYWEALEHTHPQRGSDWYWVLGIVAGAGAVAAILFGNVLFAVVILLAAMTLAIFATRGPSMIPYTVGPRGIRIGDELYPYSTLESFYLDEEAPGDVELLLKSPFHAADCPCRTSTWRRWTSISINASLRNTSRSRS